ncbi:MAG: TIGR01777 family oxidoreductase [Desulfococcaceae bacterium]
MKIFVTGGTGFVGTHLSERLLDAGHEVTVTGSRPEYKTFRHERFRYISADTSGPGKWQEAVAESDAAVNLAGRSIFSVWTEKYKKSMYDSRILTTRNLVDALPKDRETVLCSTSAVGYYGPMADEFITEDSPCGKDFLAEMAKDWETEAFRAGEKGVRVAAARFGIVLGKNGGAVKQMLPAYKLGFGGPLGSGKQWFPWIHIDDLVSAILFVLENKEINGPINFTAPEPVRQKEFAAALGKILWRPAFLPAPGFIIRTVMGEFGSVLLSGQRAFPVKLLHYGFSFRYPDVHAALKEITGK